jgi:hypothetical protein
MELRLPTLNWDGLCSADADCQPMAVGGYPYGEFDMHNRIVSGKIAFELKVSKLDVSKNDTPKLEALNLEPFGFESRYQFAKSKICPEPPFGVVRGGRSGLRNCARAPPRSNTDYRTRLTHIKTVWWREAPQIVAWGIARSEAGAAMLSGNDIGRWHRWHARIFLISERTPGIAVLYINPDLS